MSKYTQFPIYLNTLQLQSTHRIPTNTYHPDFPVAHNSLYTSHFLILRAPHLQHGHSTSSSHTYSYAPQKYVLVEGCQTKNQATRGPPENISKGNRLLETCPSHVPERNSVLVACRICRRQVCKPKLESSTDIYLKTTLEFCQLRNTCIILCKSQFLDN